mgnify:CR=1 FL=1
MRCNRRIVTNGAYRRFRRFVRWFKNSGAGARCVTNNKRKMGGQNTLRPVQLRVWRERKHNENLKMINIFRKMKQKSKDRIFSEYPCADFLHNALHFLARNKPEVTYGEICYALLKSGNKLTDEEQKIFDNYRKTGQLEMMSDDNIDDWEDTK